MKYAAAGIVLLGALLSYLSKSLYRWLKKSEPEEKSVLKIKFAGLGIVMVGVVLLLISEGR
ncbi:MAG: hypothetical protein E7399_00755 [Ruminococcaceae bacterium]|nr:hypothetical protein [Oscillospiraceae bacterium]